MKPNKSKTSKTEYVIRAFEYLRKKGTAVTYEEIRRDLKLEKNEIIVLRRWFTKYEKRGIVQVIGCDKEKHLLWIVPNRKPINERDSKATSLAKLVESYVRSENVYYIEDTRKVKEVIEENLREIQQLEATA